MKHKTGEQNAAEHPFFPIGLHRIPSHQPRGHGSAADGKEFGVDRLGRRGVLLHCFISYPHPLLYVYCYVELYGQIQREIRNVLESFPLYQGVQYLNCIF